MKKILLALILLGIVTSLAFADIKPNPSVTLHKFDPVENFASYHTEVTFDEEVIGNHALITYETENLLSNRTYDLKFYLIEEWEYGTAYPGEIINMGASNLVLTLEDVGNSLNNATFFVPPSLSQEEYLFKVTLLTYKNSASAVIDTEYIVLTKEQVIDLVDDAHEIN